MASSFTRVSRRLLSTSSKALRSTGVSRPGLYHVPAVASAASFRRGSVALSTRNRSAIPEQVPDMFCFQCEQTENGTGCTTRGVCGKNADVAALQDNLVHVCKGISQYLARAEGLGYRDVQIDRFVLRSLFATLTNVNFSEDRIADYIIEGGSYLTQAKKLYDEAMLNIAEGGLSDTHNEFLNDPEAPANWKPAGTEESALIAQGKKLNYKIRTVDVDPDIASLRELVLYGIKGMAAYAEHACHLGAEDPDVYQFLHQALNATCDDALSAEDLLGFALRTGEYNLKVMGLLDEVHTRTYGHPRPTKVRTTPVAGKCILVSGHDLSDLEAVLKQTQHLNINVYTHGELLPAHGYPGLKEKYPHLVGHYGGPWQLQKFEFAQFPGSILVTTNCIIEPRKSYRDRLFTSNSVGFPGIPHTRDQHYSALIDAALSSPGFKETVDDPKEITVGFGHHAVLGVADKVVDLVKQGKISHFFLIGGCDGNEGERTYFREMAKAVPADAVILTLACGKYRFNKLDFGDIEGIPRLLDIGQCNDAFGAVKIASALAEAFETDVNGLPLSFCVSWFEQKAVAVLLTLLHLGVKGIRLGPQLPAFVTPNVLDILVKNFELAPITSPEEDMPKMLHKK